MIENDPDYPTNPNFPPYPQNGGPKRTVKEKEIVPVLPIRMKEDND